MKRFLPALLGSVLAAACGRSDSTVCATTEATDATSATDATVTSPPDATGTTDAATETTATDAATTTKDVADDASEGPDTSLPECPWEPWGEGLVGGRVDMVAFDPRLPGQAWATAGAALLHSADGGETWEPASEDVAPHALGFPPNDSKALLAGAPSGLWSSHDIGASFEPQALSGLGVHALFIHPASPQRVFVGTWGAGIFRSDDGGSGFAPYNVGLSPLLYVEDIVGPPDDGDVVVATGFLQNGNYGAGASGVIARSTDGGRTWATVSEDVVWGADLAVCPEDPKRMLAAVRAGVLESRDGGATWARVGLLGRRDALSVAYAAASGCGTFWAAVYQQGIYRVEDDGLTLIGPQVDGFDFELARFAGQVAAHPTDPDVVLVATHAGLYRSTDAGFHWRAVEAGKGLSFQDMDAAGDRVWLGTWGNGLWTRTAASPWERVAAVPRDFVGIVAPDPGGADAVLVGTSNESWVSDAGPGGFAVAPGVPNALDMIALGTGELLATTQVAGVLRSQQPTVAWTESNEGLSPFPTPNGTFIDARAVVADPNVLGRLYLGLRGAGVAVSDDLGHTWTRPSNALESDLVMRLVARSEAGRTRLFALVDGKGVWVSDDGALTWETKNGGLDSLAASDLALDAATGALYLSGSSVRTSDDGLDWKSVDRWCLPVEGWGPLAIVEADGARWLVAATVGNRVYRHRL